jgi:2-dehydropantoate 2-reductase
VTLPREGGDAHARAGAAADGRPRVCVVGCGAIGGIFAAHLARVAEVWAYDVCAEHVAAINANGLRLVGRADVTARVHARTDPAAIPPCALGVSATKAAFAGDAATARIFAGGAVLSAQNGIGSEEAIARHVPRVIRGVTMPAGRVLEPGVVQVDAGGPVWLGPFEPQPARAEEIAALTAALREGGMEAIQLADARGAQWTKLLFNAATNPLAALTRRTHGELCDRPDLRALATRLVQEGRAVAEALGITLDDDPDELIDTAARTNHGHRPSMLQDVLAGRPTEIDALNGGIVDAGAQAGVPTPLHAAIAALVRAYAPSIE